MSEAHDPETAQAVADLLVLAEQEGYGLTFEPSEYGWHVGWMRQGHGGFFAKGPDLLSAATAAFQPFLKLVAERHSEP